MPNVQQSLPNEINYLVFPIKMTINGRGHKAALARNVSDAQSVRTPPGKADQLKAKVQVRK